MKKYVVLGFDMESDIGSYTKSYRGVRQGTPVILEALQRHGLPATFFFTGQTASQNPEVVREVARLGYEVGCHSLMHETVGEAHFDMPGDLPILEEEVEHRLAMNRKIVQELSGSQPVSFRAPRLWQGQAQLAALEKLDFLVDASYSVFAHRERLLPYHPSRDDWLQPGDMTILEIPNFAFDPATHNYQRYFCKHDQWPLLRLLGARFVFGRLGDVLRQQQAAGSELGVLLFYLHPWEFQPMPGRIAYSEGTMRFRPELYTNCGRRMATAFERFVRMALDDGFQFSSCRDFPAVWEAARPR